MDSLRATRQRDGDGQLPGESKAGSLSQLVLQHKPETLNPKNPKQAGLEFRVSGFGFKV